MEGLSDRVTGNVGTEGAILALLTRSGESKSISFDELDMAFQLRMREDEMKEEQGGANRFF
jgi:hypothetical protein